MHNSNESAPIHPPKPAAVEEPERLIVYPSIEPYKTGTLDVGDGHTIFYEE